MPAKARSRRQFGSIRKLPSGNYQASYLDGAGERVTAPTTFKKSKEADAWLAGIQSDRVRGVLRQPSGKGKTFGSYAAKWLRDHPTTKQSTRDAYEHRLGFILPTFANKLLLEIDQEQVREWYAKIGREHGQSLQRNTYMLLHAILATAEEDTVIPYNPCRIKSARNFTPVRKHVLLTPQEIMTVAKLVIPRYYALVIILAVTGLRYGELMGLRRKDIDLAEGTIEVCRQRRWRRGTGWYDGPVKSKLSERVIHLDEREVRVLADHLDNFVGAGPEALVFTTSGGSSICNKQLNQMLRRAGKRIGRPDIHAHLFRHTNATQGQRAGGTSRDVSTRLGHTEDVDKLYQHTDAAQDRMLATALSDWLRQDADVIDINTRKKVA